MRARRHLTLAALAVLLFSGEAFGRQQSTSWTTAVQEANKQYAAGRRPEAIAILRKTRATLPPIHQLQLAQLLTEHVMSSPKLPRPEAQKLLDEARAITDELVTRKQEVRMALMARSMILNVQAEQVETNPQRQAALKAESERAYENSRSVNADGSPVVKTVDELWYDAQRSASTRGKDGKDREDVTVYERFLAAHKDYVPAMMAIAQYHTFAADGITSTSAASVATRTRHLETAAAHYRRASEVATDPVEAVTALAGLIRILDVEYLNRIADATTVARAAVKKYPDNAGVVLGLLKTLLPSPQAALDPARLRAAREAMPSTPQAQYALAVHLVDLERRLTKVSPARESSRTLLGEALTAIDAALKIRPEDYETLVYKALVLKAQSDRVEQDPARKKALSAEADKLIAQANKLIKR
jgi:hypothetical protein